MDSLQFVPILLFGFASSLGLTPVSRQVAMRLGVVDKPSSRKIHHDHKPLMGGLAIFASLALALLLFIPGRYMGQITAILAGAALLATIGLLDDYFNLGIRTRLVAMAGAAGILLLGDIHISLFNTPWLDYPLTIFWVVAVTNAVNFLDNMDGLAAGLSAIAAGFFLLIGLSQGLPLVSALAAALLGSAVGFLTYNYNPASTFMGDMGALTLGFMLATLGIVLEFNTTPPGITWIVPVFVLALPVFDINLVVFTRLLEGRSPGEAGKDHTSHRLLSLGLNQRWTLFVLYAGCAIYGGLGLLVGAVSATTAWALGIGGLALLALLYALMFWIRHKYQRG